MRYHNSGDEIDDHDEGCITGGGAKDKQNAADELGIGRNKRGEQRDRHVMGRQESSKLFHSRVTKNIVLRAIDQVKPDDQSNKDRTVLFKLIESI